MKTDTHVYTKHLVLALLVLAAIVLSACGSAIIRGASPMVRMTELSHEDNKIALQLSIRNLNGVELDINDIDFSLSVDGKKIIVYQGPVDIRVAANGTETWPLEVDESQSSRELLDGLQNGDVKSLPYVLKGTITSKDDGNLRFEYEGHIYPLPGRPGHFR